MSLMTRTQLAEIRAELGSWPPATPEAALNLLRGLELTGGRTAEERDRRCRLVVPTVVRRLYDAEAECLMFRSTVARLVVANNRGDDYGLADLASELERAGVDLKDNYDEADDLARAEEAAACGIAPATEQEELL